jgi:hypothetical protein
MKAMQLGTKTKPHIAIDGNDLIHQSGATACLGSCTFITIVSLEMRYMT